MKNKFKPSDFEYSPIEQPKRPLWMNSVQSHRTSKTTVKEVVILVGIVVAIAVVWSILA